MPKTQGERIVELESRLDHLEDDVTAIKTDVREIRDALLQGKGGWALAASLFGIAVAVLVGIVVAWAGAKLGFSKPE